MTIQDRLSEIIIEIIKRYKLSNSRVAERTGYHINVIDKHRRKTCRPNADFIEKFCSEFNVNPTWIISGEGKKYLIDKQTDEDTKNFIAAVKHAYSHDHYSDFEELAEFSKVTEEVITDIFEKDIAPSKKSWSNIAAAFKYDLPRFLKVGEYVLTPVDNTFNEQVGRNLRTIRKFLKLTPEEFGEKLGILGPTVLTFEDGGIGYSDELIAGLSRRCFANPEFLKTGQGKMFTKNPLFFLDEDIEFVYKLREELAWDLDEETEKDLINMIRNRYKKKKEELKEKFRGEREAIEKELKTETTDIVQVMKGGQR